MNVKERGANKESAHLFFLDSNISLVPCLNEREVSELMEHFSLLRPLNANDERMRKKVDAHVGLRQVSRFHVGGGWKSIVRFFAKRE